MISVVTEIGLWSGPVLALICCHPKMALLNVGRCSRNCLCSTDTARPDPNYNKRWLIVLS